MSLELPPPATLAPVAFYVHHHGSGHATRCKQLIACWPTEAPIHVFTSAEKYFAGWSGGTVHLLPADTEDGRDPAGDMVENKVVHYAPINLPGLSRRMAYLAGWIAEHQPALFVVDLSVEVALFTRLCGVRTAVVRLNGKRTDPAHVGAYQLADEVLAPFPACMEDEHTEPWLRDKTTYLGLFSRYDERKLAVEDARALVGHSGDRPLVLVVNGSGGADQAVDYWEEVARANPNYDWMLLGRIDAETTELGNLRVVGYVADTFPYLRAADIVVGSGGTNTMSEIGAAGGRYLSLPEPRPYSEQYFKMRALERYGLTRAINARPAPGEWTKWLRRAGDLQPYRWRKLRSSTRFCDAVEGLAERCYREDARLDRAVEGGSVLDLQAASEN